MVLFVLPAYNEERNVASLIGKIATVMDAAAEPYSVIVVDDGSTDATAAVAGRLAGRLPVRLVTHERNAGLAAALRSGITAALATYRSRMGDGRPFPAGKGLSYPFDEYRPGQDSDVIVTMDCDNTHDPACVVAMLRAIRAGCDVVIASRYRQGAAQVGLSLTRKVLSRGVNLVFRAAFPVDGVLDFTSGYRAFRASLLDEIARRSGGRFTECKTFCATADLLLKARQIGARMCEVPLVLRYDRKLGGSKMKVARTAGEYLFLMARSWPQSRFASCAPRRGLNAGAARRRG